MAPNAPLLEPTGAGARAPLPNRQGGNRKARWPACLRAAWTGSPAPC